MECVACGRRLTNDQSKPNAARWTQDAAPRPYCADSDACRRDAESMAR